MQPIHEGPYVFVGKQSFKSAAAGAAEADANRAATPRKITLRCMVVVEGRIWFFFGPDMKLKVGFGSWTGCE